MKIQFRELDYQDASIQSIIQAFDGQQVRKSEFTIMDQDAQGKLFGDKGIGNKIDLSVSKLLQNVQQIQMGQRIPLQSPFQHHSLNLILKWKQEREKLLST